MQEVFDSSGRHYAGRSPLCSCSRDPGIGRSDDAFGANLLLETRFWVAPALLVQFLGNLIYRSSLTVFTFTGIHERCSYR